MKNKILAITFVLLAVCAIAGCGKDAQKSESNIEKRDGATVDGNSSGTGQSADDMLHFVDAHGQWYDVKIDHLVSKNEIEWKYLENDGQILNYEGNPSYTIKKGVDVSKYQGDIDWKLVKEDGYEFAIIRIGFRGYGESGKIVEDERFREYIKEAHAAGLDVGVYFFSQAVNEQVFVVQFLRTLFLCFGQCNRFHMKSLLLVCFFIPGDITQRFKNLLQLCDTPQNGAAHIPRAPAPAPGRSPLHTDTAERTGSLWAD